MLALEVGDVGVMQADAGTTTEPVEPVFCSNIEDVEAMATNTVLWPTVIVTVCEEWILHR